MSISVQGISKNFKGRRKGEPDNQVLKDVSFEIEEDSSYVCWDRLAVARQQHLQLLQDSRNRQKELLK